MTSYDIRISDWSSDVCSSDRTMVVATAIDFHLHYLSGIHHKLWLLILVSILLMLALVWLAVSQGHAPLRRITRAIQKLGRASCRERVCQYVSISVVAVSLKKKYNSPSID